MRRNSAQLPVPDADARLTPDDFIRVLAAVPNQCVLIGGQAVAWWSRRYGLGEAADIHSRDIDFWGDREALRLLARRLGSRPCWPHKYEMTVLVGSLAIKIGKTNSAIEVLRSVPGLDRADPEVVSSRQHAVGIPGEIAVLTPVSLLLVKLHALRHFSQHERNDLCPGEIFQKPGCPSTVLR